MNVNKQHKANSNCHAGSATVGAVYVTNGFPENEYCAVLF